MNKRVIVEEIFNSITHGIGVILGVIGLVIFLVMRSGISNPVKIIGVCIFATTLLGMYSMSTLSHGLMFTKAKKVFLILDRSSIFLFIAGTYTPFLLVALKGNIALLFLVSIWLLAVIGIIISSLFLEKIAVLSVVMYLCMGWLIILIMKPLSHVLSPTVLVLLFAGGIAYTAGIVFYALQRMPFSHTIWHIFVLVGSICHFFAIYSL